MNDTTQPSPLDRPVDTKSVLASFLGEIESAALDNSGRRFNINIRVIQPSRYQTVKRFAETTGIPIATVRSWISEGRIRICPKRRPKDKPLIDTHSLDPEVYGATA